MSTQPVGWIWTTPPSPQPVGWQEPVSRETPSPDVAEDDA